MELSRLNRMDICRISLFAMLLAGIPLCGSCADAQFSYRSLNQKRPEYYEIKIEFPEFRVDSPLTRLANESIRNWVNQEKTEFVQTAENAVQDALKDPDSKKLFFPSSWDLWIKCEVTYFHRNRLLSTRCHIFQYSGGAHPMEYWKAFNYGIINGKEKPLTLSDFFPVNTNFRRIVTESINKGLRSSPDLQDQQFEPNDLSEEQLNHFVLAPNAVHFLFDRCEIGPCSNGELDLKLDLKYFSPDFGRGLLIGP
jgi:hypothetical protein